MIWDYLRKNAKNYAEKSALKEVEFVQNNYVEKSISWGEFYEQSNKVANYLVEMGIRKGDKVGIFLHNCLEWLPIFIGVMKSGAIVVPLNYRYDAKELRYCLDVVECRVLFSDSRYGDLLAECFRNLKKKPFCVFISEATMKQPNSNWESFDNLLENSKSEERDLVSDDAEDAAIYFTSGTTGTPKAILLAHSSIEAAAKLEQKHHGQVSDDIFLVIPPLYHTGATMHWLGSLLVGGEAILLKNMAPRYVLETISREKVTLVWLLVPWAQDILAAIECGDICLGDYELSQWRLMHMGAQPIPPSLVENWLKIFPNHQYDTNYGLSEATGPGCIHLGVENMHKLGAIGKAGEGWSIAIFKEDGQLADIGESGELAVRGPGVMKEYYGDPVATKETIKNGWLFTGDLAYADEDGFVYIVDRKKDIIIVGGENVSAVQVESYVSHHPAVKDVAVIGIKNERVGEMILAVIELKPGMKCSKSEMIRYFDNLPEYKRPRKIVFDKVLRNSTGKIDKVSIRKRYNK